MDDASDGVDVRLSAAEALVLLDWLSRFNNVEKPAAGLFEDQAEQRVLWDLECELESRVTDVLRPDYAARLAAARAAVRDT